MTRTTQFLTILVGASLGLAACSDEIDPGTPTDEELPPGSTTGGEGNTFDHDNDNASVWQLIDQLANEGPLRVTTHLHSCSKLPLDSLGNVLRSVGIDTAATGELTAGKLFNEAAASYGGPAYASRVRENASITTSGASRLFDIFAAGAQEVIDKMPGLARCGGAQLFNGNACVADGITCLIGTPATPAHVELCTQTITRATDPTLGKRLAIAAMLAAAYTCL